MSFRIQIDHRTRYDYERPVGFSPHVVRLFPRTEPGRIVRRVEFTTNATADVQYRRDIFDNCFTRCFYPNHESELFFDLLLELELQEQNPFHFLLDSDASQFPFTYAPADSARLGAYRSFSEAIHFGMDPAIRLLPLPFWNAPTEPTPTVSVLVSLMEAIQSHIGYDRREEGAARSPAETLRLGHGACRDIAVLLAAVLREMGLASRLVSGYLCEFGKGASERRADAAMHMWTEVYLPGAGWTGLDATNGIFCNHNFVATAAGLTSAEVTPISGRYFASVPTPDRMTATLTLVRLDESSS